MDPDLIDRIRHAAHVPTDDAGLDMVAERVRRRRRWRVAAQAMLVVVALLLVPVGIVQLLSTSDPQPEIAERETPEYDPPSVANVLVPDTYTEDGKVVMPVTFPDGTTAEFVYPRSLDLASLGARPHAGFELSGCCGGGVWLPKGGEAFFAEHSELVDTVHSDDGQPVRLWTVPSGDPGEGGPVSYLVFKYGRWDVAIRVSLVASGVNKEQFAQWAQNLDGWVTDDGFLVLRPSPPLHLASSDSPGTNWLEFGSPDLPHLIATPDRSCTLSDPDYDFSGRIEAVQICQEHIQISAYGSEQFVRGVGEGLELRNVKVADSQG
jgi:hypothetical protein